MGLHDAWRIFRVEWYHPSTNSGRGLRCVRRREDQAEGIRRVGALCAVTLFQPSLKSTPALATDLEPVYVRTSPRFEAIRVTAKQISGFRCIMFVMKVIFDNPLSTSQQAASECKKNVSYSRSNGTFPHYCS